MVIVNLNDTVLVKLKPEGLRILREIHDELHSGAREWQPPKLNEDGYYKTQLWCLMQDFGPHIRLGGEVPFETEFLIDQRGGHPLPFVTARDV